MPSAMAGILLLNMLSAVASGGGRELISRDQAGPHPVSPTTDHLGALLMAPLNISWMIQAWILFGSMAYSFGPHDLVPAQVVMLLWMCFSTSVAQVVAWSIEATPARALRHRPDPGPVRRGGAGRASPSSSPGTPVPSSTGCRPWWSSREPSAAGACAGCSPSSTLVVGILVAVALGAVPAHVAAKRMPRDEARMETDQHEPRPLARSVLGTLIRLDRALGVAFGPDAARRDGAGGRSRPGGDLRQPAVVVDDDPARPGRLGWRAAVRRQRVEPRRPGRAVAREPAGDGVERLRRPRVGDHRVPRRRVVHHARPRRPAGRPARPAWRPPP